MLKRSNHIIFGYFITWPLDSEVRDNHFQTSYLGHTCGKQERKKARKQEREKERKAERKAERKKEKKKERKRDSKKSERQ